MVSFEHLALVGAIVLFAGFVKGTVGLGFPTTALGLSTLFLAPQDAIGLILLPMFLSNLWQLYRAGDAIGAVKRYWVFLVAMVALSWITVRLAVGFPQQVIFAVLGVSIVGFVVLDRTGWQAKIPDAADRPWQTALGAMSGVLGGIAAVWAPTVIVYLSGRGVEKAEFVRASGLLLLVGTVPLILGFWSAGLMGQGRSWASLALCVPVFLGFSLGERLRASLSEKLFRNVMLLLFFVMGLNLLRRAIWG